MAKDDPEKTLTPGTSGKQHVPFLFVFLTKIANAVKAVKDIKEVIFHLFSLSELQIIYF
jgi:hypothetical protein